MTIYDITNKLLKEYINKVDCLGEKDTDMFEHFLSVLDDDDSEEAEQIRTYIQVTLEEFNLLMEAEYNFTNSIGTFEDFLHASGE